MSTLSVRRPLALLAVLGMVATLLFAVAGTASAATATPQSEAQFSACPDNADIPDGGFTDIPVGSFFDDSVNCLAYYSVTTGVTPDTYEPGADVTRAQMALFLERGAAAAGVKLAVSPPDAGFTDIGGLSAEAQLAINRLADAGIVKGKTATTYAPADTVWRQHMALFLTRFWDKSIIGPGGDGTAATSGAPFTDIGATTVEASEAINQAWDLGIAQGTTATTFDPLGNVNRGQMSLFLTRTYAHANTRPAGINIQADPTSGNNIEPSFADLNYDVAVTARTDGFLPIPNTVVDQWNFGYTANSTLQTPFKTDGTCNTPSPQIYEGDGVGTPCVLEVFDLVMDVDGNYEDARAGEADVTYDLYAWTGDTGAKFDKDTTAYSMVTVAPTAIATGYTFTFDPESGLLEFGSTATWTIQVTKGGDAFAEAGWTFELGRATNNSEGSSSTTDPFKTLTTDANGQASYTATYADPSSTAGNWQSEDIWVSASYFGAKGPLGALWMDAAPAAAAVTVTTPTEYKVSTNPTANSATALVTDQYGSPISGIAVLLDSNQLNGLNTGNTVTTGSDGKAAVNYQWTGTNDTVETITATVTGLTPATVDFYWVYEAVTGDTTGGDRAINVRDAANKSLVAVDAGLDETVWTWKAGDTFRIDGALKSQADFEAAVAKQTVAGTYDYTQIDVVTYSTAGFSEFDLGT